jgi:hypothetical protein
MSPAARSAIYPSKGARGLLLCINPADEAESMHILDKTRSLLDLPREADRAMREAYEGCRLRWFRAPCRW